MVLRNLVTNSYIKSSDLWNVDRPKGEAHKGIPSRSQDQKYYFCQVACGEIVPCEREDFIDLIV